MVNVTLAAFEMQILRVADVDGINAEEYAGLHVYDISDDVVYWSDGTDWRPTKLSLAWDDAEAPVRGLTKMYGAPEETRLTQASPTTDLYYEVIDVTGQIYGNFIAIYQQSGGSAILTFQLTHEDGTDNINVTMNDVTFYYIYYGKDGLVSTTTITKLGYGEGIQFEQLKVEVKVALGYTVTSLTCDVSYNELA